MTTLPCDAEGKRSSVGADDRGHTNSGRPATKLLNPGTDADRDTFGRRSEMVCPPVKRTNENKRHGRESAHRTSKATDTRTLRKFVEVHWDTRVCCYLRQATSRRLRASNRNTSWQDMRTIRTRPSNLLGKVQVAPWSGDHPIN